MQQHDMGAIGHGDASEDHAHAPTAVFPTKAQPLAERGRSQRTKKHIFKNWVHPVCPPLCSVRRANVLTYDTTSHCLTKIFLSPLQACMLLRLGSCLSFKSLTWLVFSGAEEEHGG